MDILLADDDIIARTTLRGILSVEKQWKVIDAVDGVDAWEKLCSRQPPAVCLLDINMPRLNGLDLARRMREDARFKDLRIVMITLNRDKASVVEASKLKISGYILKPFSADVVLGQVRKVIATLPADVAKSGVILDNPLATLKRLKIDANRYREMLDIIIGDFEKSLRAIRDNLDRPERVEEHFTRLDAMRGGMLTLGIHRFAGVLGQVKMAPDNPNLFSDLDRIDAELKLLKAARQKVEKIFIDRGM